MVEKKRFAILAALVAGLALYFWVESRYPALNEKELMVRTSSSVSDTLVTFPKYKIREEYSFPKKVGLSTLNWCWENRKGMTFGVITAALLLTLFGYLRLRGRPRGFLSSLYGLAIGTPLGLCVNCAAPVFKGVLRSRRAETAFAAMLSSPTMNVVVITMVFAVFPFYMAVTKLVFTLAVIFVGVPLIGWLLGPKHVIRDFARMDAIAQAEVEKAPAGSAAPEGWPRAVAGALKDFGRNFGYMFVTTVPLMVLAGFFGALINHLVPTTTFVHTSGGIGAVVVAALVGVFLPVPMAFDVILVNAMYALGMPPNLVLVLLCTLGIFSVYSFFIVWSSASPKWAVSLFALIAAAGTAVGLGGDALHRTLYVDRNIADYRALKRDLAAIPADSRATDPFKTVPFAGGEPAAPVRFERFRDQAGVSVSRAPFRAAAKGDGPRFLKKEGSEIGLARGFRYEIRDYPDPFWLGRGTAAGDYDGDGWDDVAFGTNYGIALYRNRGGWFEEQEVPAAELRKHRVYAVAFVDLDDDGWLDLFATTFNGGNFAFLNREGRFDWSVPVPVPNGGGVLTISPAFADLTGSGRLDVVNGNMALGIVTGFHHYGQGRASSVARNVGAPGAPRFEDSPLGGDAGETMASLVSDFNDDGFPDVYLGHDYVFPDEFYLGGPGGLRKAEGFVPASPVFSMSADFGDLDNDGQGDLLLTGTTSRRAFVGREPIDGLSPAQYGEQKWDVSYCSRIRDEVVRANCEVVRGAVVPFQNARNLDIARCKSVAGAADRDGCLLATMWLMITNDFLAYDCEKRFDFDPLLRQVCALLSRRGESLSAADIKGALPQRDDAVLYMGGGKGAFRAVDYRHPGGWTWNTRMADLDNDGWQDVFNAEGVVRTHDYGWNAFMRNMGGKGFEQRQFSYGLTDDFNLISYSLLDLGNTGSLDIVGNSSVGPVQAYLNRAGGGNRSLVVSLRDRRGNRFGVGARVFVRAKGATLMREIKASGGYLSFDPLKAHFGLGEAPSAEEIRVRWRDSSETVLKGPFPAGFHYRIERGA